MTTGLSIDTGAFQAADAVVGEDEEDTALLRGMVAEAAAFLADQDWLPPVLRRYLAYGVGGVLAVLLVVFERPVEETSDSRELWVIVGDLPFALLATAQLPTAAAALGLYCDLMDEWADRVLAGDDLEGTYSVAAEPTAEHAEMLKSRVEFIREQLIPIAAAGEPPGG